MKDGFIKVAAATPEIKVADCKHNAKQIISLAKELAKKARSFPGIVHHGLHLSGSVLPDNAP
mgnify:CR=1 FL=1